MPQFSYRGRDKAGNLKIGTRYSTSLESLNRDLNKEGISPIQIKEIETKTPILSKIVDKIRGETLHLNELAIFARQMQLLHEAGVPLVTSFRQLALYTRSAKLARTLIDITEHLEKGQTLSSAMQFHPDVFPPLIYNIVQIGETTGHLSEAFGHIYEYLEFELNSKKQIKAAFRYPTFVVIATLAAIIILNVFVIPTFAKFYLNLKVALPWQTRFLISTSNFFIYYGIYVLIGFLITGFFLYRYNKTTVGKLFFSRIQLRIPVIGKLLKRIILIRFSQALAIILSSGISVLQGLRLVKNTILNAHIIEQVSKMQEMIEGGVTFTQAISTVELFSPLEIQIIGVGEKNGELSPALTFIGHFHSQELQFDLKRMNDIITPVMLAIISILILVMALGIYLPIWNMVNLVR